MRNGCVGLGILQGSYDHLVFIAAGSQGQHRSTDPNRIADLPSRRGAPQPHRPVERSSNHSPPIFAENRGEYRALMPRQELASGSGFGIPNARRAILGSGDELPAAPVIGNR